MSAKQSFGSVPPKFGSTVGFLPVVATIDVTAQSTQGLSGDRRVARNTSSCTGLTSTAANPCRSRCARTAGITRSGSTPSTNRSCIRAQAFDGIAFTGDAGLPVSNARTSSEHQPNTRSAGVSPGSPHQALISGPSSSLSSTQSPKAWRTELGICDGLSSGTRICPVGPTRQPIACASWIAGLASAPPQLPE